MLRLLQIWLLCRLLCVQVIRLCALVVAWWLMTLVVLGEPLTVESLLLIKKVHALEELLLPRLGLVGE